MIRLTTVGFAHHIWNQSSRHLLGRATAAAADPRVILRGGAFNAVQSVAIVLLASNVESPQPSIAIPMTSLSKNFNLPWIAVTCLAVWFLFVHAPSFWMQRQLWTRDALLAAHIMAAGTIYMACAHNALFTPSTSIGGITSFQWMHTMVGRVGLIAGTVSFSIGAFLAWSRLGMAGVGGLNLGFTLPITIGGIAQIASQYFGYTAIRRYKVLKLEIEAKTHLGTVPTPSVDQAEKLAQEVQDLKIEQRKALRLHIGHMIGLFASACGIPAGIRLAELVTGRKDGAPLIIAILLMIWALTMIANRYMVIMKPDLLNGPRIVADDSYGSMD